ncbi:MAG: peptidylprolyl isomerase [Kiritimatiellae bacterium]|nr:peptidylprolyl isomerase [Kiritimatiellia bacterium]
MKKFASFAAAAAFAAIPAFAAEEPAEETAAAAEAPVAEAPAAEAPAAEAPAAETPAESAEAEKPAVAVRIDGEDAIFEDEIDDLVESIFAARTKQAPIPPEYELVARAQMRRGVTEQLVLTRLLLRAAAAEGVEATDADRAEVLGMMEAASFEEAAEKTGMPAKMLMESVVINKLLTSKTNSAAIPDEAALRAKFDEIVAAHPDATNIPERVRASHILVKVDAGASEEEAAAAKAKIDSLRERALAGEDFAALAAENSDCPSKARGGDLGEFGHGQMVREFDVAAFAQPVGEIGEPVKTQFGWHIIKVTDKIPAKTVAFEDVKEELAAGAAADAARQAVDAFVKSVRDAAKIEILSEEVVSEPVAAPAPAEKAERKMPEWAE